MVLNLDLSEDEQKSVQASKDELHHQLKLRIGSLTTFLGPGSYDEEDGQPFLRKKRPYLVNFTVQMSREFFLMFIITTFALTTLFMMAEWKMYLKTVKLTSEIERLKVNLLPNGHLMKNKSNFELFWESTPDSAEISEKSKHEETKKMEEIPKGKEIEGTKTEENLEVEEKPKSENELKEGWLEEAKKLRESFPEADRGLDSSKKYMLYTLGNDYGSGLLHYSSSLWGMLAEARKLNRVLVWQHMCLPPHHNLGKLIRISPSTLFDRPRIESEYQAELLDEADFWGQRKKSERDGQTISYRKLEADTPTADVENEDAIVLERDFSGRWDVFAYSLKNEYNNAWDEQVWYAPYLLKLAETIIDELNHGDFAAVHVRRGDKAAQKDKWPNLDKDTQGDQLAIKLPQFVEPGKILYLATDESKPGFFDPLKELYELKVLRDFKHLWEEGSDWWKAYLEIVGNSTTPMFDRYQQALVDYTLCNRAKQRVETFPDLTADSWNP